MRKTLCLLLGVIILTSQIARPIFAEEQSQQQISDLVPDSYGLLTSIGIITPADWELSATDIITRAEFAVYLCGFSNISQDLLSSYSLFRDVMEGTLEEKAIYTAVTAGLMSPVMEGYFFPSYPITKNDALVAILMAMGYGQLLKKDNNPSNISGATRLLNNLSDGENITRVDAYKILYNALFLPVMAVSSIGSSGNSFEVNRNVDALAYFHKISVYQGIITGVEDLELGKAQGVRFNKSIKIDHILFRTSEDFTAYNYLGMTVKCYYRTDEDPYFAVFLEDLGNARIKLTREHFPSFKDNIYTANTNGKTMQYPLRQPFIIFNNREYFGVLDDNLMCPQNGEITLIDNNGDGGYDLVFISTYEDYFVKQADADSGLILDYFLPALKLSDLSQVIIYNSGGVVGEFSNIQNKTVISVVSDLDQQSQRIYVSSETITGAISETTQVNGRTQWRIGQQDFYISEYLRNALENNHLQDPLMGDTYQFYLNRYRELVYFEKQVSITKEYNYGIFVGATQPTKLTADNMEVRIFSKSTGGFQNYKVASRVRLNGLSGKRQEEVYDALLCDGRFGVKEEKPVAQVIEFSTNQENEIRHIAQVGIEDLNNPMLYLYSGSIDTDTFSRSYRDLLVTYSDTGRTTWLGRKADQVGVSFSGTEALQVPFRDGKIAQDKENLFAVRSIPGASTIRALAYKKNPLDLMADFVVLVTDANAPLNCGDSLIPSQVLGLRQVIHEEESVIKMTTEKKDYYIDSRFDITKLPVFNREGIETKETYTLKQGDLVNIVADANDYVSAIEPIYDAEKDKIIGQSGRTYQSRGNGDYNVQALYLYKTGETHWLCTPDDPAGFDEINSPFYLTKAVPTSYFYDRETQKGARALPKHFVGYKESSTDYVVVLIYSLWNDPRSAYVMKNNRQEVE